MFLGGFDKRRVRVAPVAQLRRADDGQAAMAGVHALRTDRRAVIIGKPGGAQLAEAAPGLERVHQLSHERRTPAARAVTRIGGAGVHTEEREKRFEVGHA